MELAGLEPATSWVRFGRALCSNCADLQGFLQPVARDSSVRMRTDYRRLPGVCPSKTALRGQRPALADAARQPCAGCDLVALKRVQVGMSPSFEGGLIRRFAGDAGCCLPHRRSSGWSRGLRRARLSLGWATSGRRPTQAIVLNLTPRQLAPALERAAQHADVADNVVRSPSCSRHRIQTHF
jgi:hypothetical protein